MNQLLADISITKVRIEGQTKCLWSQMKDMRHENVNPFLGFFHDCGVFAIVTEFCSRGSLEDLLLSDDVKLDWMFKSSLLLDLIKVSTEERQDESR